MVTAQGRNPTKSGKPKALSDDEFKQQILWMRNDARTFMDTEINPSQERMWRYYNGQVDQKPPKGRSRFVVTELRDATESAMVSMMRIFLTAKTPVTFTPGSKDDVERIPQLTSTVNHIFFEENGGFRLMSDGFRDALVAKYGCFKTFWSEATEIEELSFTDVNELEFRRLQADEDVEILDFDAEETDAGLVYDVDIRRKNTDGCIKVEAIPAEEMIIDRRAECSDSALLIGQDGHRRRQDVVNEGLATWEQTQFSQVATTGSTSGTSNVTNVRDARADYASSEGNRAGAATEDTGGAQDEATQLIRVSELYVKIDKDRDGVPELYRVICIGDEVIDWEMWDCHPFALGSAFFRPHTAIGFGLGDILQDIQEASTSMTRGMLDSLYSAVNPHPVVVQNQANLNDVLRQEHNAVWRERQPNMIRYMSVPFVGKEVMPVMEWFEGRKEMRTGISKASMGLDPDALQSSVEFGVISTLSAAQAKIETMARSLCETLLVPVFNRIVKLLAQHQKEDKLIRLNEEWKPMSSDVWNTKMDAKANVGIGRGGQVELTQQLTQVIGKQEQLFEQLGAENPVVVPKQYANALHDVLQINGIKDTARYFNEPDQVEELAEKANREADNDMPPEVQIAQQQLELDKQKAQADAQIKQQEAQADAALAAQKMQADAAFQQQKMAMEQQKMQFEQQLAAWKAQEEMRLKALELGMEAELERYKIANPPETAAEGQLRSPTD